MLYKKQEINYWVFQGNPKFFDFETALKDEILTDWTVNVALGQSISRLIARKERGGDCSWDDSLG